ncbi:MAG: aminotransferase class IV [Desulfonatronovibrionaceae bacterium]
MPRILEENEYIKHLLSRHRPNEEDCLAFYDHRLGAVCRNPRLMLVPVDDHLVHRGDGVFETLKMINRRVYLLDAHLERLQKSCRGLDIRMPAPAEEIRALVLDLLRAVDEESALVSMYVGRGPGGFTTDIRECPESSLYIVIRRMHHRPESFWEKGVTVFKTGIPAKQGYLARIKTVNYLPNVLMKKEAVEKGYDFPLCFDENNFLAEGATENVIVVDENGKLIIPDFVNALAGTTLMRALELIKHEKNFIFRSISEDELYSAREIIMVGTTLDAVGVIRYNDKPVHDVRPGPVALRLRQLLREDVDQNGLPVA